MYIPKSFIKCRKVKLTTEDLVEFELKVKKMYEDKKIRHPIHLSGNNERSLIEIFKYISNKDYVFSNWRSHYHALLHGVNPDYIIELIIKGKSMSLSSPKNNFYSSSIVGGCIPIALGTAMALKKKKSKKKVWCFIGDMTFETGTFHESYKYSRLNKLNLNFIIEDNGLSTNTPTKITWGGKSKIPKDVIYYKYKRKYPHHGVGKWILF